MKRIMLVALLIVAFAVCAYPQTVQFRAEMGYVVEGAAVLYEGGVLTQDIQELPYFTTMETTVTLGSFFFGGGFDSFQDTIEWDLWYPGSIRYGVWGGFSANGFYLKIRHYCQHPTGVRAWSANTYLTNYVAEYGLTTVSIGFSKSVDLR